MREEKFTYAVVTPESPLKGEAEAIYNEAFPAGERCVSFDDLLRLAEKSGIMHVAEAGVGGKVAAFLVYIDAGDYIYLMYFAVRSDLRGSGYGTELFRRVIAAFQGRELLGAIETPLPGTSNLAQREKRVKFYTRLGLYMTKFSYGADSESLLTFVSDRPDEVNRRDVPFIEGVLKKVIFCLGGAIPPGNKLYITESAGITEIPAERLNL